MREDEFAQRQLEVTPLGDLERILDGFGDIGEGRLGLLGAKCGSRKRRMVFRKSSIAIGLLR